MYFAAKQKSCMILAVSNFEAFLIGRDTFSVVFARLKYGNYAE